MFTLTINTDNEAFTPEPGAEVARILRVIADRVEAGRTDGAAMDVNGNRVGSFAILPDRPAAGGCKPYVGGVVATRYKGLGYGRTGDVWRIFDTSDGESAVGPHYRSKAELLADLDRYAREYGADPA